MRLLEARLERQKFEIIILRMRKLLQVLWMALVLIVVALLSALIAMSLAVHGREVTVPNLQGKSPAEARKLADESGLAVEIEREYYSPTIPAGHVVSQMPAAGSVVRRGWEVRLAVSLGPQRVTIPQVVGQSERAATISIEQRGLDISATAQVALPGAPSDMVIGQDPPANATDVSAPKMSLLITEAPAPQAFVMPSFVGQPLGTATNTVKQAGFSVGKVTMAAAPVAPPEMTGANAASGGAGPASAAPAIASTAAQPSTLPPPAPQPNPSPASIIVAQDPAPGQKIMAGSAINFVVR